MSGLDKVRYAHYPPVKVQGGSGITVDSSDFLNPIINFTGGIPNVSGLQNSLASLDGRLNTLEADQINLLRKDQNQTTSYFISQNVPYFSGYFSAYTNFNFVTNPTLTPTVNQVSVGGGISLSVATNRIYFDSTGLYCIAVKNLIGFQTTAAGTVWLRVRGSSSNIISGDGSNNGVSSTLAVNLIVVHLLRITTPSDYIYTNFEGNHANVNLSSTPYSSILVWRIL